MDRSLSLWAIKHQTQRARHVFGVVTYLGSGYVCTVAYLILFVLGTDRIKAVLFHVVLAELLGLWVIIVLRNLIKRERPTAKPVCLHPFLWQNHSFPSHHALRVSMLATLFGSAYPLILPFLILSAAVVSVSRIYLERHYPLDVLAGLFIGFVCAWFIAYV